MSQRPQATGKEATHVAVFLREVLEPPGVGVCPRPSEDCCEVRSSHTDRGLLQALPLAEHLELLCGGRRRTRGERDHMCFG